MKKTIFNNYVLKLKEASDSLKGTSSYNKYYMMQESKITFISLMEMTVIL